MLLELAPQIEADLDEVAIAIDQEDATRVLFGKLRAKIMRIGENPLLYQLRPDIGEDARLAVVGDYIILFRVLTRGAKGIVRIERIIHGARDLRKLLP